MAETHVGTRRGLDVDACAAAMPETCAVRDADAHVGGCAAAAPDTPVGKRAASDPNPQVRARTIVDADGAIIAAQRQFP